MEAEKERKRAGARFLLQLALRLLVALILFARMLAGVLTALLVAVALVLAARLRLGVLLTGFARLVGLELTLFRLLALTRILALTFTLLVGTLIRVLLATLFVRHNEILLLRYRTMRFTFPEQPAAGGDVPDAMLLSSGFAFEKK